MNDLKKVVKKLKAKDPVKTEKVKPANVDPASVKAPEIKTSDPSDDDLDEDEEKAETPQETKEVKTPKNEEVEEKAETPQETKEVKTPKNDAVEHEIALLQNDAIFRRELLVTLKDLVDVHKVGTQTMLDLLGELNGKKTKNRN